MKKHQSKRIIAGLLAASLVMPMLPITEIGALVATAAEAVQKTLASDTPVSAGLEFTSNGDGTCSVLGIGDCTDTDIVIPTVSPEGDRVTSIGDYAFSYCESLTSIAIPDSVTTIGEGAFEECINLTSITIPDSVTSIGEWAFFYTAYYNNENNWEDGVLYINNYLIKADAAISGSYQIKAGTKIIAGSAFSDCESLTSITIPDSVTTIEDYAFIRCTSLTVITIPDNVTLIGDYAFSCCESLESISVSENNPVYHSAGNCIIETESKTLIYGINNSVIPHDGSVTSIGDSAFWGCENLTSIAIPDSVTSIGAFAFRSCTSLIQITIPDSMISLGEAVFFWCTSLTSITIPDSVTSIGSYAFNGCASLTEITIPDSVTSIEYGAFMDCTSLTSITIPDSVTSIETYAFMDCTSLTRIMIPDSVTSIESSAFYGCESLESISVSENNLVYHSAGNCIIETESKTLILGINNSVIPHDGSVTSIGASAFSDCRSLTSITIPNCVTSIEWSAFSGCTSLTSITIPDSVTSIEYYVFEECSNLSQIRILNPQCYIDYDCDIPTTTTIYGYVGSTAQAYAEENGNPFVALPAISEDDIIVEEDKVTIDNSATDENVYIPSDVITNVAGKETTINTPTATITFDSTASDKLASSGDIILNVTDVTTEDELTNNIVTFTITLRSGGAAVLPAEEAGLNGSITVSVPYLPGMSLEDIKVTYIGEDGSTEDIPIVAYDPETGIVTFVTTHLSRYEISFEDVLYGDANGDGVINGKDVLLLRKYMANYDYDTGSSTETVFSGADANGDGVVNGKDVLLMRKYMANYDYDTESSTVVLGPAA